MTSTDRVSAELRKLSEAATPGLNFTRDDLERALLRPCYESGSPNVPAWNGYTNPVTELIFALIYDLRARIAAEDAAPPAPAPTAAPAVTDEMVDARETLRRMQRTAEMSAAIMRDAKRTGSWEGAEKVARQFERLAEQAEEVRAAIANTGAPVREVWRPDPAPKDGKPFWAWLYDSGIRKMRWGTAEEWAEKEGGLPEEYIDCYVEVDDEDEVRIPHWWLPLEAISLPPDAAPSTGESR